MTSLLPCPFCGDDQPELRVAPPGHMVACVGCCRTMVLSSPSDAINMWNRRVPVARPLPTHPSWWWRKINSRPVCVEVLGDGERATRWLWAGKLAPIFDDGLWIEPVREPAG